MPEGFAVIPRLKGFDALQDFLSLYGVILLFHLVYLL
jgi:hypothetical protein